MREEERLIRAIGGIDDELILEAEQWRPEKKKKHKGWIAAAAACLCLLILWQGGILTDPRTGGSVAPVHLWRAGFPSGTSFKDLAEDLTVAKKTEKRDPADAAGAEPAVSDEKVASANTRPAGKTPQKTDQEAASSDADPAHVWKEGFAPQDYFADSPAVEIKDGGASSGDAQAPGNDWNRIIALTNERQVLENQGLIPLLTDWSEFYCLLAEKDKRTDVSIQWARKDDKNTEVLSVDLSSGEGAESRQEGVVNQRDGIVIYAVGEEDRAKQLSYEKENVATTITGTDNTTYEEVVNVLDWYWDHPDTLEGICALADQKEENGK